MTQGLSNAPATFNRLVTQLFRPHRGFAQTYFDDIFVHSRAGRVSRIWITIQIICEQCSSACAQTNCMPMHLNAFFGADKIPFLECFIEKRGLRADPAQVKAIVDWPVSKNQKDLRKWLSLANYYHKYSENYADMAVPLSNFLKKDTEWCWTSTENYAFQAVKDSLIHAPVLALPNLNWPFSVVCDASNLAIGSALLQTDVDGHDVVCIRVQRTLSCGKNYPVHDKELLAMKNALVKFKVHLLGSKSFVINTDHASLRTATKSPHLSQRMA